MPNKKSYSRPTSGGGRTAIYALIVIAVIIVSVSAAIFAGFLTIAPPDTRDPTAKQVDGYLMVKDDLSNAAINAATVYIWKVNPFIDDGFRDVFATQASVSTGIADFGTVFYEGETIWVQVRQAAPTSADPYMSPIYVTTVGDVAEANDEILLGTILVRDINTAPTLRALDQANGIIENDTALFHLLTTDTKVKLTYDTVDSDDWWGMIAQDPNYEGDRSTLDIADPTGYLPDPAMVQDGAIVAIMDGETGYWYATNLLLVTSGAAQPISNYDIVISAGGTSYYVTFIEEMPNDASITDDGSLTVEITFSSAPVADAVFDMDIFDLTRWDQMANGVFSGSLNPTAIASKVA